MKLNKWTIGLAAIGVVSLASAVKAEETANSVQTALSSTTLSGYVDTSMQWNFGTASGHYGVGDFPEYKFGGANKADGFNLNVIQLTIAKPLDESEWAAGYHVDLWFGPDANTLNTSSGPYFGGSDALTTADFAIRQAYIALRTPIGNGIDWKVGVFDSPIGYESVASPNNPNYTRSYGHTIEPQTLTGILGSYRFSDNVSVSGGIANTKGPVINQRAFGEDGKAESFKTYMATVALTAPDDWGFLSGSTLYGGVVNGMDDNEAAYDYDWTSTSWYVGATIATPVTGLRLGAAWDYLDFQDWGSGPGGTDGKVWAAALYASYQASEKLSLHFRGEYLDDKAFYFSGGSQPENKIWAFTATAQYDLWKNVISRLEFRWDHADNGKYFGNNSSSGASRRNAAMLAANIIYKF